MIIGADIKTNTWLDLIESGGYKDSLLSIYKNEPPKITAFDLIGFSDLLRNNSITMSLLTKDVPATAAQFWGGANVTGVRVELRLMGIEFYTSNFWYSPDEATDTRRMKHVTEHISEPGKKRTVIMDGAFTAMAATISIIGVSPTIGR